MKNQPIPLKEATDEFLTDFYKERKIKSNNISIIKKFNLDILIQKIQNQHSDSFKDACYKRGIMPYPSNLLITLFDLAETRGTELSIDEINKLFPNNLTVYVFVYKDYYFETIWGQGVINTIYNRDVQPLVSV